MCFSTSASLGAASVLLATGSVAFKMSQNIPQKTLSAVPIIFSVQQFSEGVLWLSMTHASFAYLTNTAMYAFLMFAQVVWPIYIPLLAFLFEEKKIRKRILAALAGAGALLALCLFYCLISYMPTVSLGHHHITYDINFPIAVKKITRTMYFLVTVVALFISSNKPIQLVGVAILLSLILTMLFFHLYFISVWCYFAAVISGLVIFMIMKINHDSRERSC